MPSIFEQASRTKLRFNTARGNLTTEDLWSLPLINEDNLNIVTLNSIAVQLDTRIKQAPEVINFVSNEKTEVSDPDVLGFEIVKHVIAVRVAEEKAKQEAAVSNFQRTEKRKEILAALRAKETDDLKSKSKEELEKMLTEL